METNGPLKPDLTRTPGQGLTKEQALVRMLEGHRRYLSNKNTKRTVTVEERARHADGQFPFAAILGCADSRVSPELIFDQGQGDLFVVRVAGNVVGTGTLASLEYAIQYLGVCLFMVLGHEQCGAVKAAMETADAPGALGFILREIAPALNEARSSAGCLLDNTVRANVAHSARALVERSELIDRAVKTGKVRIVGAIYRLSTGDVEVSFSLG